MAMKEINLGRVLAENRRRRGITQDQLAEHLAFPKPRFPSGRPGQLSRYLHAAQTGLFFDISIDALMG